MIKPIQNVDSGQNLMHNKVTVLLADDHPLMRDSMKMHLENDADIKVIAEANDGEEVVKLATELVPDIIVMDIAMPKLNGIEATRQIKAINPRIGILVLTVHSDSEYILKALEAGAAGYLTKNIAGEELIHAIRSIIAGESVLSDEVMRKLLKHALRYPIKPLLPFAKEMLTTRELEIFKLAARGMSNKQIAQDLNLNLGTVKGHLVNIFSKLNVCSRTEAVITGLRSGFFTIDDLS